MSALSDSEMLTLAGGPVASLKDASDAEPVSAEDVASAAKLADEAEQLAAETERKAVLGEAGPGLAVADREAARFARLRAQLTARRAERYTAAQRIKGLHQVGEDALALAGRLEALKADTEADLAEVEKLLAGVRARIVAWNQDLEALADHGAELQPEDIPPSGAPLASSAGVWAGRGDGGRPRIIVKRRIVSYISVDSTGAADLPAAIAAADQQSGGVDASTRLILTENGQVMAFPLEADKGGHIARRIREGTIHELTLAERRNYLAGKPVTWEMVRND